MKALTKLLFAKSPVGSLFAVALMAWSPLQTRADMIAFSVSGGSIAGPAFSATLGYAFTLSSPVTVTNLGLFDSGNDGFAQSHAVTIWTSTGTQLVQTTIPAGTGGTLINGFRYVSIAPLTLAAGTYTIAGFYGVTSDASLFSLSSITGASGVSYLGSRGELGFTFPTGDAFGLPNSYFGPNFKFTTGVPTPDSGSTVSLLGFGLLALAALRRKLPSLRGRKS
jgi:protein with PEP-CTERM/exosortase system signal